MPSSNHYLYELNGFSTQTPRHLGVESLILNVRLHFEEYSDEHTSDVVADDLDGHTSYRLS